VAVEFGRLSGDEDAAFLVTGKPPAEDITPPMPEVVINDDDDLEYEIVVLTLEETRARIAGALLCIDGVAVVEGE